MSGVFGRSVPPELQEAMQHAQRLCAVVSRLEGSAVGELGQSWVIGRCEEIEKVLSLVIDDWEAKRRTDEGARLSVLAYLDELHSAVRRLFGPETVLDCCFGNVVATEPVQLENATRQVELPPAAPFASSDSVADPQAVAKRIKSEGDVPSAGSRSPSTTRMDVAPIAEDFLERLLYETDAFEAVRVLSDRWSVRTKRTGRWLGLSRPEHHVTMVLIYVGEVGNGGHTQFFSNRGGDIAARAREALREVGLPELDEILQSACAMFPGSHVPSDRAEVDRLLDTWGKDCLAEVDRLDRRAWREKPYPRLLAYLREREADVLRPERGLAEASG